MRAKLRKISKWLVLVLLAPIVLFFLSAWVGAMIPRNGDWVEADPEAERTISILVVSNGIHTQIVMPKTTPEMDWSDHFPTEDLVVSDALYSHIGVGWGERAFFLETPIWSDFELSTGINALIGGEPVLHVAHYLSAKPQSGYGEINLRPEEYRTLTASIVSQLATSENRQTLPGYGVIDVFYSARGTYHLGNNCNQWTSDRLSDAGVKIGQWTPHTGSVMRWLPKP